jgi:endonuclease-3 related protein
MTLVELYYKLLNAYGHQGWWPLISYPGVNPTTSGSLTGYHPTQYDLPQTAEQRFEICVGAILTQNTAWLNVEKALLNLWHQNALSAEAILALDIERLKEAIRPSGYFNVKAKKLLCFSHKWLEHDMAKQTPSRKTLLNIWGIGPETADSMRLYAFNQPEMMVDAYTKRILANLGYCSPDISYEDMKQFLVENLPEDRIVYQEFHALLVEHAKHCYNRKPWQDWLLTST